MTIDKFANISNVSVKTIKKNLNKVPGAYISATGECVIPDDSRYPYDAHRYKFDNINKRRTALLDATYKLKYIDSEALEMTENSFNTMINELVIAGYLVDNHSCNPYGANKYNTTLAYDNLLKVKKHLREKELAETISSALGHFVGGCIVKLDNALPFCKQ